MSLATLTAFECMLDRTSAAITVLLGVVLAAGTAFAGV
jgi:hypothetical protein